MEHISCGIATLATAGPVWEFEFAMPEVKSVGLRWLNSGARNHLPANKPLELRFEIVI